MPSYTHAVSLNGSDAAMHASAYEAALNIISTAQDTHVSGNRTLYVSRDLVVKTRPLGDVISVETPPARALEYTKCEHRRFQLLGGLVVPYIHFIDTPDDTNARLVTITPRVDGQTVRQAPTEDRRLHAATVRRHAQALRAYVVQPPDGLWLDDMLGSDQAMLGTIASDPDNEVWLTDVDPRTAYCANNPHAMAQRLDAVTRQWGHAL